MIAASTHPNFRTTPDLSFDLALSATRDRLSRGMERPNGPGNADYRRRSRSRRRSRRPVSPPTSDGSTVRLGGRAAAGSGPRGAPNQLTAVSAVLGARRRAGVRRHRPRCRHRRAAAPPRRLRPRFRGRPAVPNHGSGWSPANGSTTSSTPAPAARPRRGRGVPVPPGSRCARVVAALFCVLSSVWFFAQPLAEKLLPGSGGARPRPGARSRVSGAKVPYDVGVMYLSSLPRLGALPRLVHRCSSLSPGPFASRSRASTASSRRRREPVAPPAWRDGRPSPRVATPRRTRAARESTRDARASSPPGRSSCCCGALPLLGARPAPVRPR